MTHCLCVDRFEGDRKQIAVLVSEDGVTIDFPRTMLPRGTRAGDLLKLTIERDLEATRQMARAARMLQDELRKTDPGGDISL